ncbi:unnamed protein product (macronuclear) [Paramecium tetraurelia]|uniref:Transmembrane protein n=1 Tax=Paramecium tetraurelia TaxID=5888 RepID=A0D5K2_PARTE|nr:uncharacterized protein GSPATT00013749001 [Paramecium tetraurelia]CAK78319.1 unnamed protein product [Paramecium tetraurelia]|eukprot:XP_001445716.1 hypothetical protein (macronuclear) [Paramecium tetraurelia strain d4-2]
MLLFIGILCVIQEVRSAISTITQTLNPTQQQFTQQLNLTYLQQYIYITAEFKYVPLSYQYYNNFQSDQNKYIIFSLTSDKSIAVLAYLAIDSAFKICMEVHLINDVTQTRILEVFELPQDPLLIEGNWFTLELRNNLALKQVNVTCYQNQNMTNLLNKIYSGYNIEVSEYLELQAGKTQDIGQYYHLFFQGPIRLQVLDKSSKFWPQSISCTYNSYYEIMALRTFDKTDFETHQITSNINKCFGIATWIKVNKTNEYDVVNVLKILASPNANIGDSNELINLQYQINTDSTSIKLDCHSYTFPVLQSNTINSIQKPLHFQIPKSLYEWHHLSIAYQQNQVSISLSFPQHPQDNVVQVLKQVYLYSDTNQTIFFGGYINDQTSYYSNTPGQFNQLRYFSNLGSASPLPISCHTNCLTCFGPYSNQCLSCQASRYRDYYVGTHECLCKTGYLEIGYSSCIDGYPQRQEKLIPLSLDPRYDSEYPNVVCSFGYFRYENVCYQCPKVNRKYPCFLCLANPNTWVYEPKCLKTQVQINKDDDNSPYKPNDNFVQLLFFQDDQYDVYIFQDLELILCEFCRQLCLTLPFLTDCKLSKYVHLSKPTYIVCQLKSYLIDGKCKRAFLGCSSGKFYFGEYICTTFSVQSSSIQHCLLYRTEKCEECEDNYFQSYDSDLCLPCSIQKCKFCFEYYQDDVSYSSVIQLNKQINREQLVTGCALCYQGYQFNFATGICEIVQQIDTDCLKRYIDFNGKAVCYETATDDFSKGTMIHNCQRFMLNCNKCIQPASNQYYCGECQKGYYYNRLKGICLKCSSYNEVYTECSTSYVAQKDTIYNQILGFTFQLSGIYPINMLKDSAIERLYPLSCADGYSVIANECILVNTTYCTLFSDQCVSCNSDQYGTKRLTVMNMACQECPFYCEYCQIRTQPINLLNPYFNSSRIYQGYQCLQKSNRASLFIDNYYGHVRQCNSTIPKCQTQISLITTNLASLRDYLSVIYDTQTEFMILKGVSILTFQLNVSQHITFSLSFHQIDILSNQYVYQVITLQTTEIVFNGLNVNKYYSLTFGQVQFQNMQKMIIQNLQLNFSIYRDSLIQTVNIDSFQLYLMNVTIMDSYSKPDLTYDINLVAPNDNQFGRAYQIQVQNPQIISIINVMISNMSMLNTTFLNLINSNYVDLDQIVIQNLTFFNCSFFNTDFLALTQNLLYQNIQITTFNIKNCTFNNGSILHFSDYYFKGNLKIQDLQLSNSIFINSILFILPQSNLVDISSVTFQNCKFQSSSGLRIRSNSTFQKFRISNCHFVYSNLISSNIYSSSQIFLNFNQMVFSEVNLESSYLIEIIGENIFYVVSNIDIRGILASNSMSNTYEKVFYCQGFSFKLSDVTMFRFRGVTEFQLENFEVLELNHIVADSNMDQIVSQIFDISASTLIINYFIIKNQKSEDSIFISVQEGVNNRQNYMKISNLQIMNIQMIKKQYKFPSSIIQIVSSIEQSISIQDSQFLNIWQNQELQDPEISTASLIVLNVPQSSVLIKNLKILNCLISNATDSLILINSKTLDFQLCFSNMTNNLESYFKTMKIEVDLSQIQQMSYGGLAYMQVQELTIKDSQFYNSIGYYGGVFYIITKFNGIANIVGLRFENISTFRRPFAQGMGGCLYIDSQYSYLQLNIIDVYVTNSSSNYIGGFLYVKPSIYQNVMNLRNLEFFNVFSSQQSIISFIQMYSQQSNSTINLRNVTIRNEKNQYKNYLEYYGLTNSEGLYGLITIQGTQITISRLNAEGYFYESILHIEYSKSFKLSRASVYNSLFDGQTLLFLQDISSDTPTYIHIDRLSHFNIYGNNRQQTAIVQLFLSKNCVLAQFDDMNFYNITCQKCQSGILSFSTDSKDVTTRIRFQGLTLNRNLCGQNGCFNLLSNSSANDQVFIIKKSKFINNIANDGGSIFINNLQLQVMSTLFLQNEADNSGGAIFYWSQKDIHIQDCYFYENKASTGGAIFLGSNALIQNQSTLQFTQNSATSFGDNLAEQPKFLQLIINNQEISNLRQIIDQTVIDYPILKQKLYFPTGSKLSQYEFFNYTSNLFSSIQYSIQLKAYNHIKEEIMFLDDTKCLIAYDNQQANTSFQDDSLASYQIIVFNSTKQYYDLNELLIVHNPYDDQKSIMLDIKCDSITDDYHLRFSVETLKCQIGEYFYEGACLRCNSAAGYYSVAYNSTSCKRIDIKLINQTNGAILQLQPFYWRPHLRSDLIEKCQKYPSKCLGGWFPGELSCSIGSIGALCEECDIYNIRGDGYFLNSGQTQCSFCGHLSVQVMLLLISSFWSSFLIIMTVKSTHNSLQKLAQLKVLYLKYQTLYTFSLDQTSILIKMSNNYFQILMVISTFQIDFFTNLRNTLQFLGEASSFVTYQIDCTTSQITNTPIIYSHFILMLLIPFFNFALSTAIYCISIMAKVSRFSQTFIFTTIIYLYIYNQQAILNWGTSLISKRKISGYDYIQASVFYYYDTEEHANWLFKFVIPIVAFQGIMIPLLLLYYLYYHKGNLYNKSARKVLSYLINEYSDESYYWELIKIAYKLLIIVIINFLEQQILIKGILIYIIIILYYQSIAIFRPYRQSQFNLLEQTISYYVSMTILLSLLLYQIQNLDIYYLEISLIILILYLILKLILLFIEKIFIAFFKRLDEQLDPIRGIILMRFPNICKICPSLRNILKLRKQQKQRILERFYKIKNYLKLKIIRFPTKDSARDQVKAKDSRSMLFISQHRNTFTSIEKIILTQGNETAPLK